MVVLVANALKTLRLTGTVRNRVAGARLLLDAGER